ncbi:Inositol monophosphatase 1 [Nymphon striatum]|nr:Inositol monophosphatase 1 [Nymphon striatum]
MACVDIDHCYKHALRTVKDAGKLVYKATKKEKAVHEKDLVDVVTETDRQVEVFIIESLRSKFPSHMFIGEESTAEEKQCELTDRPTWIIDPIDGTMNFVEIGLVYNPLLDKMYAAKRGYGAFCNGTRLQVSKIRDLTKAMVLAEVGSPGHFPQQNSVMKNLNSVSLNVQCLRCMGSSALGICMIAAGEAEAYFEFPVYCWDIAAANLIAEEAGALVRNMEGGHFDLMSTRILCANSQKIIDCMVDLLAADDNISR